MKKKNHKKRTPKAVRTASALTNVATNIMTYTLEGLIREKASSLFTALYLSAPEETIHVFNRYPDNEDIRYVVKAVITYHKDMDLLQEAINDGFFETEVNDLLTIAAKGRIAGARFTPVFYAALEHAEELCLSEELQKKLHQHIEHQKQLDGFAIMSTANNTLALYFAKDVIPV